MGGWSMTAKTVPVEPPFNSRLIPEVILIGDHTMGRVRWTLDQETERLQATLDANPKVADHFASNGWTARMVAWGHIIHGLMELGEFDDEKGRA